MLHLIERDLARPLLIEDLAAAAGYSPWHFQRMFAAVVGEPVASYVRRRRLTEAATRLQRDPAQRLLDVALDCGFESHEAFTRAFRSVAGTTPRAFRLEPDPSLRWMRRPLRAELLSLLPPVMNLEPTIEEHPALSIVGLSARFIAAVSPDANNLEVIPPLWGALSARRAELRLAAGAVSYGACRCLSPAQRSRPDELEYLAGFALPADAPVPAGMVRWDVPAQRCARFTHRGPVQRFGETLNYIYGSWFPRSEYELADGVEIEIYDARFHPPGEDSEVDYLVPIQRRRS